MQQSGDVRLVQRQRVPAGTKKAVLDWPTTACDAAAPGDKSSGAAQQGKFWLGCRKAAGQTQCKTTTGRRSSDAERSQRARWPAAGPEIRWAGRISANDDGVQPAERPPEPGRLANHQARPRSLRRVPMVRAGRTTGRFAVDPAAPVS